KLMDELGIYLVQFGRVGHGESDLNPKRSLNTEAYDIEKLAAELQLLYKPSISHGVSLDSVKEVEHL
ncbi:hypothetical protein Tco_1453361, partial [Tanacetum coccineum]